MRSRWCNDMVRCLNITLNSTIANELIIVLLSALPRIALCGCLGGAGDRTPECLQSHQAVWVAAALKCGRAAAEMAPPTHLSLDVDHCASIVDNFHAIPCLWEVIEHSFLHFQDVQYVRKCT
uniref:Secreted protein n=1 Tax=Trichuris muris TaxID=70415 RepID=A0A5S6QCS4_TRIMR